MRNKTMNFELDYPAEESDKEWSQASNMENESPTSLDWNTIDVSDTDTLQRSLLEIDPNLLNTGSEGSKCKFFLI